MLLFLLLLSFVVFVVVGVVFVIHIFVAISAPRDSPLGSRHSLRHSPVPNAGRN
jgi:energy-coupling factor transporter transmembrane protein EcfT